MQLALPLSDAPLPSWRCVACGFSTTDQDRMVAHVMRSCGPMVLAATGADEPAAGVGPADNTTVSPAPMPRDRAGADYTRRLYERVLADSGRVPAPAVPEP